MGESFGTRIKNAWNAFNSDEDQRSYPYSEEIGSTTGDRPDRVRVVRGGERSIISSIYNRIAVDVASTTFEHVYVDEDNRYVKTKLSGLNECLNLEANIDQTGFALMLDAVMSMLQEGVVAIVPVETKANPNYTESYDVLNMRVGKVVGWHPQHVDVDVYDERTGYHEILTLRKRIVSIVENPFYSVMNEPNSTLKRLTYKLALLDKADERANSSKLDIIIQLPYAIKTDLQSKRAETRKKDIEMQLIDNPYGIAYLDATERVTQLNRPIENNLMSQINDLTSMLYGQLGLDETILKGTADAETMNNYYSRTVATISKAFADEFTRKFLSKTARSQGQKIMTFQEPFRYLTVNQIAGLVDSLSRNEVLTGNEFRTALGFKPSSEPSADELRNKNLIDVGAEQPVEEYPSEEFQNESY